MIRQRPCGQSPACGGNVPSSARFMLCPEVVQGQVVPGRPCGPSRHPGCTSRNYRVDGSVVPWIQTTGQLSLESVDDQVMSTRSNPSAPGCALFCSRPLSISTPG